MVKTFVYSVPTWFLAALMDLVDNDVSHIREKGVWLQPFKEDAGGAKEEAGAAGGLSLQADGVAHQPAHRLAPLLGHTARHAFTDVGIIQQNIKCTRNSLKQNPKLFSRYQWQSHRSADSSTFQ